MDLNFNFSGPALLAGFIFSIIGFYLFKDWRRSGNPWHLSTGLALMIYPYFINAAIPMIGVGLLLSGVAYVKR